MLRTFQLALAALAIAAPAQAQDLKQVLDRHLAWRGGAAYAATQSIAFKGAVHAAGLNGQLESWSDRTGRVRGAYSLGPISLTQTVAAEAWSQRDGVVEALATEAAEDLRHRAAIEFAAAYDPKIARLIGSEARDGRTWAVVRLLPGTDVYDAFIDPTSGQLLGFRIVEDRRARFLKLGDWRTVDGVRVPFLREETSDTPGELTRVSVQSVEINKPMADERLARPQSRRVATFKGGAASTGPMTFDFFRGNRIYIPAKVNGHDVKVLLDSGAETSVLDRAWADAHGIKSEGQVTAIGTGGQAQAAFAGDVSFEVGSLRLQNLNVATLDLSAISKQLGAPLPVILGAEVFKQLIVDIDFETKQIAFHDPKGFKPPKGAVVVPVKSTSGGIRSVPVSIEGGPTVQVDFDIGNGSPFLISPAYWQPRNILEGRPSSKVMSGAVGGMREQPIATLKTLTFGGVTFRDVPAIFQTAGNTAVDSERSVGNVGLPILSRFRMITDYPNDRLFLVAHKDAAALPFAKNRVGVRAVRDAAGLKVMHVAERSPAAAAGFKIGDVVAAIDGKPVDATFDVGAQAWQSAPAGTQIRLTMADGSVRIVQAHDYY
jgi:hypothetical protein